MSVPMTLSDLERRDARGQILPRISVITLVPFELERTHDIFLAYVTVKGN